MNESSRGGPQAFVLFTCFVLLLFGCGGSGAEASAPTAGASAPERRFGYATIDGRRFDSASTRGRFTVVLFLTTYDLSSQLAARQLGDLVREHVPRINAGAVVLEPVKHALLVEAFASALSLPYPVALADRATLDGDSAFGRISMIPTFVILSPEGREVWRSNGWVPPEAIERKLPKAGPAR